MALFWAQNLNININWIICLDFFLNELNKIIVLKISLNWKIFMWAKKVHTPRMSTDWCTSLNQITWGFYLYSFVLVFFFFHCTMDITLKKPSCVDGCAHWSVSLWRNKIHLEKQLWKKAGCNGNTILKII